LLGSVAEAVLRKCDTPVLLTRAGWQAVVDDAAGFEHLLVALDGSRLSEISLDILEREEVGPKAAVDLVRVVPRHAPLALPGLAGNTAAQPHDDGHETERHAREAQTYLDKVGNARFSGRVWQSTVPMGSPCAEILDTAAAGNADLIVVATHGREGIDKVLYGSVALDLLRHVEVPLLVVQGRTLDADSAPRQSAQSQAMHPPVLSRPDH
jgi:nucleotide-binding universal stress UspA family protein